MQSHRRKFLQNIGLATVLLCGLLLSGCQIYGRYPVELREARRIDFFYYQSDKPEKLSVLSYRLTGGSRGLRSVKAANPQLKSDAVPAGTIVRIPVGLIKSSMKSKSFVAKRRPAARKSKISDPAAGLNSGKKQEKEILPGGEDLYPEPGESEGFETYDPEPYMPKPVEIVPAPRPTPDPHVIEERKLRERYKDIMEELDS